MTEARSDAAGGLDRPAVQRWLFLVWLLILAMVVVGGTTRLTGSGLSMVEWRPLFGAIPPLDDQEWSRVFARYQQSPQYQQVNHWMRLEDFKRIFLWEYLHRLLGRAIGLAFCGPWVYFLVRRRLSRRQALRTGMALLLGGLQGLLGWYMVKSGLVDVPQVSHFRLAAHLLLAFAVGQWVAWLFFDGRFPTRGAACARPVRALIASLWGLLVVQVVYGAFMAGTRAGYYYGTFPDMNGHFAPRAFFDGPSVLQDALSNPSAIHYLHRALGWLCLVSALGLSAYLARAPVAPGVRRAGIAVGALTFVQFNLGALTVVRRIDLPLAVAHQGFAFLLLTSITLLWHRARGGVGSTAKRPTGQSTSTDADPLRPRPR